MKNSLFLLPLAMAATAAAADRPNVILVMTDDMGYECLGCYGGTYPTPNLDRLAEEGIRFDYGFAQPLSTPSRVQIMTGKYNCRNYVQFGFLDQTQKTIGHLAQQAGYATAIAGKWQLGANYALPAHFGFESYCLWHLNPGRNRYARPSIVENGIDIPTSIDLYGPEYQQRFVDRFIEEHRDSPFFLYYPMTLVHNPFLPTPDSGEWSDPDARLKEGEKRYFSDMVAYCDRLMGELVAKLKKEGIYENTIIIFTGDNGTNPRIVTPMKDGSSIKGGKGQTTDAGTHAPLLAIWGGRKYDKHVCDDLVDFTDMMPTLAAAMGTKVPAEWGCEGVSFYPRIAGGKAAPRKWVFCHYQPVMAKGEPGRGKRFIRDHQYKLYSTGDFYDVRNDIFEKSPIAAGSGSPEAEKARKYLASEMSKFPAWQEGDRPPLEFRTLPGLGVTKDTDNDGMPADKNKKK